jgi:hypothetical protein
VEPNYYREQYYRCLDNVFHLLDGKGAIKTHYGALYNAVKKAGENHETAGTTEYFEFKAYKNGNLHLKFRRMDLVKKLNAMAANRELKEDRSGGQEG